MKKPMNTHRAKPALSSLCLLAVVGLLGPCLVSGEDDPLMLQDFSHTNIVRIQLGEPGFGGQIGDHGLRFPSRGGGDIRTVVMNVQGESCRCFESEGQHSPKAYFPFTIDSTFKGEEVSNVRIDVEYFDGFKGQEGVFGLQYDAVAAENIPQSAYKQYYPNVPLKASQKWLKTTFRIRDAKFQNSQAGNADFRLWASPPVLCVSRVTVTLEPSQPAPKETPLTFSASGEAKLGPWNLQWDSGSKPFYTRELGNAKEGPWVEVRAPGTFGVGSWRTTALLKAGEYQFVGKAKTQDLEGEPGAQSAGVSLRRSYQGGGRVITDAPDWTTLTYDFTLPELTYVELICEVRGSKGSARFDVDSLKLIRKGS